MAAIWHRFVFLSKMCKSFKKNIFWNWTKYFPFGKYWFSWKSCWVINNSLQTALNFSKTETTFVSMLEGVVSTLTCIDTTIINNSDNTHLCTLLWTENISHADVFAIRSSVSYQILVIHVQSKPKHIWRDNSTFSYLLKNTKELAQSR